jgi:tRNA-modifying protein YgfZ
VTPAYSGGVIPTLVSPLLGRPGAVAGQGVDAGVADHYGDPLREQRTALTGPALVDRSHRGVIRVEGPDRLSWLHSLTSQHLESLRPGEWTEALVLSPHGHVEHHLTLVDDGAATWFHVEPGTTQTLVDYLNSMRFMLRVEVSDESASYAVLSCVSGEGPVADELVARERLVAQVEGAELPVVGHGAFEALRVAAGRPRLGFETDHRTIPHEVGWLHVAVHLDKGCYRGQETVARVHNLGRPPRRLVLLHLDGTQDNLPSPHTPVELDDRAVGFLGTAVHHADLGPIALAVVKRQTADDAHLTVAGMAAKAERLVDA